MKTILFKVLENRQQRVYAFIVSKSEFTSVFRRMSDFYDSELEKGKISSWKFDIVDSISILTKSE